MSHERHSTSNHDELDNLFNNVFRLTKTNYSSSTLLIHCEGDAPVIVIDRFPSEMGSNTESVEC